MCCNRRRTKKPVADDNIDLETLQEWQECCKAQGLTFNQYRAVRSTLTDICVAGRANISFLDGKWSVIWDDADSPIVQHFAPANSAGFKTSRGTPDKFQALRVRFVDAENDWQ